MTDHVFDVMQFKHDNNKLRYECQHGCGAQRHVPMHGGPLGPVDYGVDCDEYPTCESARAACEERRLSGEKERRVAEMIEKQRLEAVAAHRARFPEPGWYWIRFVSGNTQPFIAERRDDGDDSAFFAIGMEDPDHARIDEVEVLSERLTPPAKTVT